MRIVKNLSIIILLVICVIAICINHNKSIIESESEIITETESFSNENDTNNSEIILTEKINTEPIVIEPTIPDNIIISDGLEFEKTNDNPFVNFINVYLFLVPDMFSEPVCIIPPTTQLNRLGINEFGWSLVQYNETVGYVQSLYLGENLVYDETIVNEILTRNSIGRLICEDLNIDVALFEPGEQTSQQIVDAPDSAVYLPDYDYYYHQIRIGDHSTDGFTAIRQAVPNETVAYIHWGYKIEYFLCTDKFIGYNTKYDLTNLEGNSIAGMNDDGICMYTCNTPEDTITITLWQPIEIMPSLSNSVDKESS